MVQQAYIICSASHLLKEELKHLEDVFVVKNNFPIWIVKKILKQEKEKIDNRNKADKNKHTVHTDEQFESKGKNHLLMLPVRTDAKFASKGKSYLLMLPRRKRFALNKVIEKKPFTQHSCSKYWLYR